MKFLSPHQPNLQVHGAGRFTDGRLELADADAASISRVRAIAPHWGIQEVTDWPGADVDDFDPRGVNLEGEGGVLEHLAAADDEERARIIDLERQSEKPRRTVLNYSSPVTGTHQQAVAGTDDHGELVEDLRQKVADAQEQAAAGDVEQSVDEA